jgi:DNA invertase Pin-like site-specific DNA recombinase
MQMPSRSIGQKLALRAAQYVRMSTENQKYSLQNQMDAITAYAISHGIEIVRTFADAAKSGLDIAGRPALAQLLEEAQSGVGDFELILVYDVSRWGRFLDTDESAHYEYLCRAAGVSVTYCAEQFEDQGFSSSILKLLKRAMAAEYSRELSVKTFAGQCSLVRTGFRTGGTAPYGLRRLLLDTAGAPKAELASGQYKNIKGERVVLTPGLVDEVQTVRRIYNLFVAGGQSFTAIGKILHTEGAPIGAGGIWTGARVRNVLINESYIGNLIYNRRTQRLKEKSRPNAPDKWVRCAGAFEPIIDPECFRTAQRLIAERARSKTDAEMLTKLSALHKTVGRLSKGIIERSSELPDPTTYRRRFGSLRNAYALIGHPPPHHYGDLREDASFRRVSNFFQHDVIAEIEAVGAKVEKKAICHPLYRINDQFNLRLAVVAATRTRGGPLKWRIGVKSPLRYDLTLAARMDSSNSKVLDYYFLPNFGTARAKVSLGDSSRSRYNHLRSSSLRPLLMLCSLKQSGSKYPETIAELAALLTMLCQTSGRTWPVFRLAQ